MGILQLYVEGAPGSEFQSVLLWERLHGRGLALGLFVHLLLAVTGFDGLGSQGDMPLSLPAVCQRTAFQVLLGPK